MVSAARKGNIMRTIPIIILFSFCVGLVLSAACVTSAADQQVYDIAKEGYDKFYDNVREVNSLSGSALKYKIGVIHDDAADYKAKMTATSPESEKATDLKIAMIRFFQCVENWSDSYLKYLNTKSAADLDVANLHKAQMMDATKDMVSVINE